MKIIILKGLALTIKVSEVLEDITVDVPVDTQLEKSLCQLCAIALLCLYANVIVECVQQISMSNFIGRCFQSVAGLHGLCSIPQVQTEVNSSSEDVDTQMGNKG